MATVTKTIKETSGTKATWTLAVTKSNITVSGEEINIGNPSGTAKFVYSGKTLGRATIDGDMRAEGVPYSLWVGALEEQKQVASGTAFTLRNYGHVNAIPTDWVFTSANKIKRTLNISFDTVVALSSNRASDGKLLGSYNGNQTWSNIATLTLNAPPTLSATGAYGTPQYTGFGAYTASVSSASAQYGGDISSLALTIGSQTEIKTYASPTIENQTVSLTPNVAGTFTPVLTVTDSRGQTTSVQFDPITVQQYIKPSAQFNVYRSDATGARADEGAYGLITANIDHIVDASPLQAPIVQIDGTTTSNITWYSDATLQTSISDWSTLGSPVTVYGLINGSFSPTSSYLITLIVQDGHEQGDAITQTLSTAFYTIDIKAGGKEIAFGAPASENLDNYPSGLFKCDMAMKLNNDLEVDGEIDASGEVKCSNIGVVYSDTKSVAISNTAIDNNTDGASITVPAGTYIVIGQWQFNTRNSSGITNSAIRIYRSGSSDNIAQTRVVAGASNWNCLQCMAIVELPQQETLKVCGATSIAYSTAQNTFITAIRIK